MNSGIKKILSINFILFLIFVSGTTTSSCKSKKAVVDNTSRSYSSSKLFKKLKKANVDYEWYSFKSSATAFFNGMTVGGSMDVRIKKDEVVWLSVKKFGFEIVRALIKPDSFYMVDRFNKEYMAESLESFKKKYDIPVDFRTIQEILVGNSVIENQKPLSANKIGENFTLITKNSDFGVTYKMDSDYKISNSKFKSKDNRTIETDFSKYKPKNGKVIPHIRKYSFPNNVNPKYFLNLKIKKVEINKEKKIKFEIPKKYTKV